MENRVVVCGQVFPRAIVNRINVAVRDHPEWSRADLARQVCHWLDWRSANGKDKEVASRVALLRLARRGLMDLPPVRRRVRFGGASFAQTQLSVPWRLQGQLQELRGVKLIVVTSKTGELDRQWKKLVAIHHYLGYRPLCGAQLRYLVASEHGYVGALGFSAAALYLKARERWIGWSHAARQYHLPKVVANSRFVIARGVRVKNLASKVLALAQKRLPEDWAQAYGYRPLLLETYVESQRFGATSYRAANWIHVGKTRGRGRQDREHRKDKPIKDIYLYPLVPDCQKQLCEEPGPARLSARVFTKPAKPPQDWAEEEFGQVRLRDRRHRERLCVVARDFFARPQANIPQACQDRAKTKATYRLFEHHAVKMDTILAAHYHSTMQRIAREQIPVVLAVQDTTSFNYDSHMEMEGLGPINTRVDGAQGIVMHGTMAYTTQGTAMGLVDVQVWARDPKQFGKSRQRYHRPIEQKESYKWLKSLQGAARLQRQLGSATTVVSVGDREADIYELFWLAQKDPLHPKVLVRAESDRPVQDTNMCLWQYMETQPLAGERLLRIPRRKGRAARDARLEVRFAQVQLRAPKHKPTLGSLTVWAVYVTEVHAPSPKEAVEWMLLTTVEVNNFEQALEKVDWYKKRWSIEEYHRTIKSVCRIESRQLGDRTVWENCLAIDLVVAWRIEHIKKISRESPQVPCTVAFDEQEWQALFVLRNPAQSLPSIAPSLHQMTRWTAELGGFLGGKKENPGSTTLGRGLQHLHDILIGVSLAEQLHPKRPFPSHGGYG
jgi:hypothetical protein